MRKIHLISAEYILSMIRRIDREQVRIGMFICGFGGSWFLHPFWRAKFLIGTDADVTKVLKSGVPYVLIDDQRGLSPEDETSTCPVAPAVPSSCAAPKTTWQMSFSTPETPRNDTRSSDRKKAERLIARSKHAMVGVMNAARLGRAPHVAEVVNIVNDISESVTSNKNALLSVLRLKNKDEYTYLHSVAVCTLMVNAAYELGLDVETARDLGLAGLLHDIGKMCVPEPVLNKEGPLTDEEFAILKDHPRQGHELLLTVKDMTWTALDVCLHHHEKVNGHGYPHGLGRQDLSLAARLGAICDVYDALTSDRVYKKAWSPGEAIAAMWSWEGHFDKELLFTFMQSISVFPVGMLVRLRSNRLGMVLDNARRNSRPRACAFFSTRDRCFCPPEIVTIKDSLDGDKILSCEDPRQWGLTGWASLQEHLMTGHLPASIDKSIAA
jgi:putative nucleotidyltransferase with HDIG domain